jgi:hypothetical protein
MTDTNLAVAESEAAPPQLNESEVKAKRLGWVPKDEFKGDPEKHRSAEEFLERGEAMMPFLKRDNDKLHQSMTKLERRLEEQAQTFTKFVEFSSKAEERAYKKAKSELEAKLDSAVETADVAGARQVRKDIADLEAAKPEPVEVAKPTPQLDPIIQSWIGENEWFNKDKALNAVAVDIYGELEVEQPGASKADLLAETKRQVMEKFPKKFGINPNRDNAAAVASPGGIAPKKKPGKTYDDLPADAKAACTKFVKTIPGYTKEKYVKDYEWD